MKKLIVITVPFFFQGEADLIARLFENGMERLHLRKPNASIEEMQMLLEEIPPEWHSRIVVHDHFELLPKQGLGGVHLNGRHPSVDKPVSGTVSRSCHSLDELRHYRNLDYLFLSPLFESISKEGYGGGCYSEEELRQATAEGVINNRIIALGGICLETMPLLKNYPFGGYAVLGAVWGKHPEENPDNVIQRFMKLKAWIEQPVL